MAILSYGTLGGMAGVAVGLYLLRRWTSSKWGYFKSDKSLSGQVIIITGANTGLGYETALDLAKRGATIIIACRSWERTRTVLGKLRKLSGNNDIHFIKLDLASLQSVKEFAADFLARYERLDVLVCNAGVWVPMELNKRTVDNLEIHAGVNHLAHFYLTRLLLDRLQESSSARLVVVSSSLMRSGQLDLVNQDPFQSGRKPVKGGRTGYAPTGYCDSKLMNALFTKELAVRTGEKMVSVCVCPGWCATELARYVHIPLYKKILFLPFVFLFMRSAARGAHNIIHAVVEEKEKLVNGGFYRECGLSEEDNKRLDSLSDTGLQLWQISERLCDL